MGYSGMVKKWEAVMGRGLVLDGVTFPWAVALEPMLRVEPIDEHHHVLWVPVLIDGLAPEIGRPDGDVPPEIGQAVAWDEGYRRGTYDAEGDLERADNPYVVSNEEQL